LLVPFPPTPEGIMEYLQTAPIPKLTQQEKEELGIAGFKIDRWEQPNFAPQITQWSPHNFSKLELLRPEVTP